MLFPADVRHHLRPELAEGPVLAGRADQVTPLSRGVTLASNQEHKWQPRGGRLRQQARPGGQEGGQPGGGRAVRQQPQRREAVHGDERQGGGLQLLLPSPLVQTGENVDSLFHSLARLCQAQGLQQPVEYEQENTPSKTRCCGLLTR